MQQGRQYTDDVILRRVPATNVAVGKQ